jgi:haloacetate dehalogenase
MFPGFVLEHVTVGPVTLRVRHGGNGPAIALLHGHPRTHTTWYAVAPLLAAGHTVVAPDLRGYGGSTLPPDEPHHAQSSKRAMAGDVAALMTHLGHERFAVVGHDRGALAAFRTAMDHPERVTQLVVMDGLPVIEHLERTDATFAAAWWHWWFLGQTGKPAERYICADPDAWYTTPAATEMGEGNYDDVWAALRNPSVVHGMAEDYRAGLGIDRDHDAADRAAGRRITCATMLLESVHDDLDIHGDPVEIWQPWLSTPLRHVLIESGHHQAEQAPHAVAIAIIDFLQSASTSA